MRQNKEKPEKNRKNATKKQNENLKNLKTSKQLANVQEESTGTREVFWGKLDHDLRRMSNLIFEKFVSEISEGSP